jgi:hypothetical protein
MTEDRMALIELLQKSEEGDFLRCVAEAVLQLLMEADVEGLIGAARHERSAERLNYRNGYRDRTFETHPEAASGLVFSALSGAAQNRREGTGGGYPGSLDWRRVDPPGR